MAQVVFLLGLRSVIIGAAAAAAAASITASSPVRIGRI